MNKWQPEIDYANEYRLVDASGEILAKVYRKYGGEWVFGLRMFTDPDSAKAAAERSLQP